MPRPFRFAVTARWAGGGHRWKDFARRAEGQGYDVLLVTDHMGAQLAPIPAMMAAADATERLRVGSFVFANDYRNPVMLAKEIATMDVLSGGRVELGIGAGWNTGDYASSASPTTRPRSASRGSKKRRGSSIDCSARRWSITRVPTTR